MRTKEQIRRCRPPTKSQWNLRRKEQHHTGNFVPTGFKDIYWCDNCGGRVVR